MALVNGGAAPNCDPIHTGGSVETGFGHGDAGWELGGGAGRYDTRADEDFYSQTGILYRFLPLARPRC